jgi:putative endonuclease
MYSTYILKSLKKQWFYIGHTYNIKGRIKQHNSGQSKSTNPYKPFVLVYEEKYATKGEAFKREQQIKKYRHGEAFKKLIGI